ncbi:hypothetical protein [Microbacterium trichothecenolyticum]|uniref:PPE family protein n=1 Tax=Microbacterium trichothecenolyticum TaxID=69370 RepID=A0ABU0TV84_MICTR|nr:hypothetical protein [Microbacterium trichothecenolyticum]MDQ1123583.1 hypothetical protein [Microbacterium trichothecenolyticum]
MTGTWEQRLIDFAERGPSWDLPHRQTLLEGLQSLRQVLQKVADDPGLLGESGRAATASFAKTAGKLNDQITYVQVHLPLKLHFANLARENARESLASLPPGEMSPQQQALVRGAAVGSMFVLGPWAFVAGEGASLAINNHLAGQREAAAKAAMERHSAEIDEAKLDAPPEFDPETEWDTTTEPPSGGDGGGTAGGGDSGRSFERYPDWNVSPVPTSPGSGGDGGTQLPSGQTPEGIGTLPGHPGPYGPYPDGVPGLPGKPPIDLGNLSPAPTPDGPISGSPTLPGGIPSLPGGGGGLVGTPGGPGAGIGSGLAAGLVAGGGGALALGRVGNPAAGAGAGLFGRPAGGAATGGGARTGGLLGRSAASGLGARGVGGLGGVGAGSGSGSSAARGAGTRGGIGSGGAAGTAGGGRPGASAAAGGARGAAADGGRGRATAGGARAAAGATRGAGGSARVGGIGGSGSRSEREDEKARGLGGPIAPRMEDDAEVGPRSENAQAGGRESSEGDGDDV